MSINTYLVKIPKKLYNDLQQKLDSNYLKRLSKKYSKYIEYKNNSICFKLESSYQFKNELILDNIDNCKNLTNDLDFNTKHSNYALKIIEEKDFKKYYENERQLTLKNMYFLSILFEIYVLFNKINKDGITDKYEQAYENLKNNIRELGNDFEYYFLSYIEMENMQHNYSSIKEENLRFFFYRFEEKVKSDRKSVV